MMKNTRKNDAQHLRQGYALLKEAIDEFAQVYYKDNVMAHAYRVLGAIEETLYQMITENRRAM